MKGTKWHFWRFWFSGRSVLGRSRFGPKYFRDKASIRLKFYWAEVFFRLKCASGRSILGAKVSLGLKWSWGQTRCDPRTNLISFYGVFAVLSFLIYDQATSIKLFSGYNYSSQAKQWTYKFYIELYFLYCWFNLRGKIKGVQEQASKYVFTSGHTIS